MNKKSKHRKDGVLPMLKTSRYPTNYLFYDTETRTSISEEGIEYQVLKLGVARFIRTDRNHRITVDDTIVFYDTDTFMAFISKYLTDKKKLYIFAHNIGFDIMVLDLPQWFLDHGIITNPPIQNNAMFLWRVKLNVGTLEFINTGNYVLRKLSDIGDDLGIKKLSIDFDNTTDDDLIIYCKRDVEILKVFIFNLIHWLDDNNLGSFKSTSASIAFSAYRTRFMKDDIVIHTNPIATKIERKAYKGGRTEAHKIGDFNGEIYGYYDINSMYPHVMKDTNFPSKYLGYIHNATYDQLLEYMKDFYIIANVTIKTHKPFFPIKYNPELHRITNSNNDLHQGKLIFPTGRINEPLHHDELLYAINQNMPIKVHGFSYYKRGDLFGDYVDFFTKMKIKASEENNKTNRLFSKLLLNSLYGKFGQKHKTLVYISNIITQFDNDCLVIDKNGSEICKQIIWQGKAYHDITNGESTYSFPAIAGAVTAKARMLLWEYIERVELKNLFYCDTDSLITNTQGWGVLKDEIHPTRLGALALEKASNHLTINGAKDYVFSGERVLKGVPKTAEQIAPRKFRYFQFEGFRTWRNRGASGSPRTWMQIKEKLGTYDKGIVAQDGSVSCYNIEMLQDWITYFPQ